MKPNEADFLPPFLPPAYYDGAENSSWRDGISQLSDIEDQLVWVYLFIIWIIAIGANALILTYQARNKSRLRALDQLMKNIAFSNGFLAVFTFPLMIISLINHKWVFGLEGCMAYGFITTFCGLVSVWTLVGVAGVLYARITMTTSAMMRHLHFIRRDLRDSQQTRYTSYISVFLAFVYVFNLVLCVMPLLEVGRYGYGKHGTSCTIEWTEPTLASSVYLFVLFLTGLPLPLGLVVFFYSAVIRSLLIFSKTYGKGKSARRWIAVNVKTLKMAIMVAATLIICWTPYTITSLWQTYGDAESLPVRLEAAAALFAKTSTAVTPIAHLWFIKKYQLFFKQVFVCLRCKEAVEEDDEPSSRSSQSHQNSRDAALLIGRPDLLMTAEERAVFVVGSSVR